MIDIYRVNYSLVWMELVGGPCRDRSTCTPSGVGATFANKTGPQVPESSYSTSPRAQGRNRSRHQTHGTAGDRVRDGCLSLRTRRTLIHNLRRPVVADHCNGHRPQRETEFRLGIVRKPTPKKDECDERTE